MNEFEKEIDYLEKKERETEEYYRKKLQQDVSQLTVDSLLADIDEW